MIVGNLIPVSVSFSQIYHRNYGYLSLYCLLNTMEISISSIPSVPGRQVRLKPSHENLIYSLNCGIDFFYLKQWYHRWTSDTKIFDYTRTIFAFLFFFSLYSLLTSNKTTKYRNVRDSFCTCENKKEPKEKSEIQLSLICEMWALQMRFVLAQVAAAISSTRYILWFGATYNVS